MAADIFLSTAALWNIINSCNSVGATKGQLSAKDEISDLDHK